MNNKLITVFGVGFIGKSLIFQLLKQGYIVRAVCRKPYLKGFMRSMGSIGQLDITYGDITKKETIEKFFKNSEIIINLVGVLAENSKNTRMLMLMGPVILESFQKNIIFSD